MPESLNAKIAHAAPCRRSIAQPFFLLADFLLELAVLVHCLAFAEDLELEDLANIGLRRRPVERRALEPVDRLPPSTCTARSNSPRRAPWFQQTARR